MSSIDKLAKELKVLLDESNNKQPKAYSTTAEVTRVEDDTIWVHIPGGIEETPVRKTINASRGDVVKVNIENGGAWVIGNVSAPPTDDAKANKAFTVGENAFTKATEAEKEALRAGEAADRAESEAIRAGEAADRAESEAIRAGEAADRAETEANRAYKEAEKATGYANDSLSQLSIVEDVVGTLNWITTHATYKASADTEVHAGKWYFTKSGDTYNVVTNPTGNPSAKGYYEVDTIDEAVSNYVASHLALTNEGLYLTKDGNGYKILLANDGLKVYDPGGHLVSTFGESIIFDSARPQTIGNNNVYIKYYDKNNDGTPDSLAIKADEFLLSSGKTIQEELEGVENWFYSVAPTTSNPPASSWTTDKLKEQHLRDIYFDTTSGKSYRWAKEGTTYKWVEIEDVELAALAKDLHDNYPPRSEFTVAPDKIQSTVSAAQTAATNAANTATDNKLKSYSTTTQMNSAIEQKAGEITASVSSIYETKSDATSKLNTAKGYTDSEITSAKAEIKVTTDGISTEVSKKVGSSEVISKINQSAETVKIQASKVEIDGTATFNAIKAQTDAAYDAKGAAQTAVDGIEIGGRNLIPSSINLRSFTVENNTYGPVTYTAESCSIENKRTDTNTSYGVYYDISVESGAPYMVSVTASSITGTARWGIGDRTEGTSKGTWNGIGGYQNLTNGLNTRKIDVPSDCNKIRIYLCATNNGSKVTLSRVKFEKGNRATDWSLAPEDIKSVHTLETAYSYTYANILTYSAEGYGGTSGANWTVSDTSGIRIGDTARLKVTVSDMSNAPVYVVGTVTAVTSGTVLKMTSHGLDTTVIDGGNILTNSIGANQIKANAITIGKMNQDTKDKILNSNIAIGGENLLQQFLIANNPTGYGAYRIPLTENLIVGETYILQLWGIKFNNTPAGGTVSAFLGGGSIGLTGAMTPNSDGYVVNTFTVTQDMVNKNVNESKRWFINIYNSGPLNSKTARNMTLMRWKLEKGNKATDWSLSSADTKGGVNLLRCTAEMNIGSGGWAAGHFRASGGTVSHVSAISPHPDGVSGATRVTNTGSSAAFIGLAQDTVPNLITNKLYTLSGWIRASAAYLNIDFEPIWQSSTQTTGRITVGKTDTSWSYFSVTLRLTGDQATTYSAGYIYVANVPANGWFEVCGLKLEEGPIATGWSPAPEDLAATATSYITNVGSDGIRVHPASTGNNSVLINSDGMTVYKGGTADTNSVAFYGDTARIGKKASRHIEVKTGGMQVYNGASDSDLVAHIGYESVQGETGPLMGAFFTFGVRQRNQTKGAYSVAEGYETTASGYGSHAEGVNTTASGTSSHAEGQNTTASATSSHAEGQNTTASETYSHAEGGGTTASGTSSHAEGDGTTASGYYSHAEGKNTTASGTSSHAEGNGTTASGYYSHVGGYYTHASRSHQTVIGKYNKILSGSGTTDSPYVSTDAAFIIGGGTARTTSDSKDIFSVGWDGNVELAIDSSATGSSTVDGKIMDLLRSLGWDASTEGVIV